MGSMRFERQDSDGGAVQRVLNFDSSPDYSLCRTFGWAPETYRQEAVPERTNNLELVFRVYAAATAEGTAARVGTLYGKTREKIWAEMGPR